MRRILSSWWCKADHEPKKTKARLIWVLLSFARTTTVPKGEAGRKLGDDDKYNAAATRVMKKHGVEINDLNALTDSFGPESICEAR